ncbi:MAG: Ig-like domain-containing protein [Gemmatimonadota bacterium]
MRGARRFAGSLAAVVLVLLACRDVLTDLPDVRVRSVTVSPDSSDLVIGASGSLNDFPLDQSGAFRPGRPVTWVSADPSIATVNDTGGIIGVSGGSVTITATVDGVQGSARVRVGTQPGIGLTATTATFNAQAGQANPAPQTITISNTGGLSLTDLAVGTIQYTGGQQNWLLTGLSGTIAPVTLTLTALSAGIFAAGTYTATVPVTSTVAANSPLTVTVTLVIAPGPPAARVITITAGNNQSASAGSAVTVAPSVQVSDTFGNAVSGLSVTFSILSGSGSVTGGSALTDAAGNATVGSWTLGASGAVPATGFYPNQLLVTSQAASSVAFQASAYFNYTTHVHPMWASAAAGGCTFCHTAVNGLGGLSLGGTAAATYPQLFNVPTTCQSGQLLEVSPGGGVTAEAASLLVQKLDHTAPAACPSGMPSNSTLIPAAMRDTIRAWVRAGAPLN